MSSNVTSVKYSNLKMSLQDYLRLVSSLLTRVNSLFVPPKMIDPSKGFETHLTLERLLSCVGPHVATKFLFREKCFGAH